MPVANAAVEMLHERDPRDEIMEVFAPLLKKSGLRALGHDVLVGVYDRAGKQTAGKVWMPNTTREDQFQGKVGIILAMGPLAHPRNPEFAEWFGEDCPKVGDWIGINVRDGFSFLLGERTCRQVEWRQLRFGLNKPDMVG